MFKYSAAAVLLILVLAGGTYGAEAGRAANATLGQAILDQAYIVNGEVPNDTLAHR